ncbi:MAG: hypothetical protein LC808_08940, partial [Actinobacteria bacterium]|nr:hypothetical protein [Actinomycetota bacterium]
MTSLKGAAASGLLAIMVLGGLAAPSGAVELPGKADDQAVLHTHGPDGLDLDPRLPRGTSPYDVDKHAAWAPGDYDGLEYTSDQADPTNLPTFHAIYMYPKDGVDRFTQFAAMFQADARAASGLLSTLYGRGVRWDERTCTPPNGGASCLDITAVKSSSRTNQFSNNPFSLVKREIDKLFKNSTKKYVVWLDTTYTGACGQGNLYQDTRRSEANNNNLRTLSVIYKPYDEPDPAYSGGFCRG